MSVATGSRVSRRHLLKLGAAALSGAAAAPWTGGCQTGSRSGSGPDELVVGTNGGVWYENVYRAAFAPFERQHNVKIVPVYGAGNELLNRAMAERARPSMDAIVTFQGTWRTGQAEGLFEKVDESNIPFVNDIYPFLRGTDGYGPFFNVTAWGIVYNEERVETPPRSYKDLWRPDFSAQTMIGGIYHYQIHLAAFAYAWTGNQHEVDTEGFAKVKELAPRLAAFYGLTSDAQSKFQQDVGAIATWYSAYARRLRLQGIPLRFVVPEEGAFLYPMAWRAIKGTRKLDLVEKLMGQFYEPETVRMLADLEGYVPANRRVLLETPLQDELLAYDQIMSSQQWDWPFVNTNERRWLDRWNREVKPLLL